MSNLPVNPPANPFDNAFEMLGQAPQVTTESINANELGQLVEALTTRAGEFGRIVLLKSPRAGFGKTHLLMRLHQRLSQTHEFIPLEPSKGRYLDDQLVLDAVLRRFSRMLPEGGGLTLLDLLARRILALGLEPLVRSGEVPSQDREGAMHALRQRPVETFDFHNDNAVTAQWAMANFALLGPRLTAELAERLHGRYRPVAWWVELLFRYSSAPLEQNSRNNSLFETVFGGNQNEAEMHERLVTFLNLAGLVTSPVLVLDEVEGLSSCPEAGLQLATFLNTLHQSCKKLALIFSVNGDVWQTAFLPRLPCGLKDRLNDIVVDLHPISKEEALLILRDRAEAIAEAVDFDKGLVYPRGLIREASSIWSQMIAEEPDDIDQVADSAAEVFQDPFSHGSGPEQESSDQPGMIVSEPASGGGDTFKPDVVRQSEEDARLNVENAEAQLLHPQAVGASVDPTLESIDSEVGDYQQVAGTETPQEQPMNVTESPFSSVPELVVGSTDVQAPQAHAITQEDHDKIEDLLKQFRDRYGRG